MKLNKDEVDKIKKLITAHPPNDGAVDPDLPAKENAVGIVTQRFVDYMEKNGLFDSNSPTVVRDLLEEARKATVIADIRLAVRIKAFTLHLPHELDGEKAMLMDMLTEYDALMEPVYVAHLYPSVAAILMLSIRISASLGQAMQLYASGLEKLLAACSKEEKAETEPPKKSRGRPPKVTT